MAAHVVDAPRVRGVDGAGEATRRSAGRRDRPWQCVYLEIDAGDADCFGGEAVLSGGERTGAVSSGAWGPSVGASLAFGYVRPEHAASGTDLEVLVLGEPRPARVLAEARYDPGNLRPRAEPRHVAGLMLSGCACLVPFALLGNLIAWRFSYRIGAGTGS